MSAAGARGSAAPEVVLVTYTTRYREGGPSLARAAETLASERRAALPDRRVELVRVESKAEFTGAIAAVATRGERLAELHFVGHSGMYGPMFRTTAMPEQLSPHEWRTLAIPFAPGGEAFFHACRTARWFAPFFARTFGVPASGYHWYTTFSTRPDRFVWPGLARRDGPLYLIGCRGKKSDGLVGSALKYAGLMAAERMKRFTPSPIDGDASYDGVADLYDAVFADITVRAPEWRWLSTHLPDLDGRRLLDVGTGNGALLHALAPRLGATGRAVGVDASPGMIGAARRRLARAPDARLAFDVIDGPRLPFADASFDVVVSLLSFRYLDWDPIMNEIRRVLAPGGRLLIVDMVTVPIAPREWPRAARDLVLAHLGRFTRPGYGRALARLTRDPRWATMLQYNPIRAQHEYVWYLESRFPGRRVETIDVGWHNRVLAFDSGPLAPGTVLPQSYP